MTNQGDFTVSLEAGSHGLRVDNTGATTVKYDLYMGGGTTFIVDSVGDTGDTNAGNGACEAAGGGCTLRAAIEETNVLGTTVTITFVIAGDGPHTISPGSELPDITNPVPIDGTTDDIILDGNNAGPGFVDRIQINDLGAGSTVKGLVITGFSKHGVHILNSPGNTIGGTDPGEGNVITDNGFNGILINQAGSNNTVVQGNFIGTDGFSALGNGGDGVLIQNASNNTIGGSAAGAGNVISDNSGEGVSIIASIAAASNNTVQGNLIGTKADGVSPLGNNFSGISILANGVRHADDNTIGGAANAANIIAYNGFSGVQVRCGNCTSGRAERKTITFNSIYANGSGTGIDLAGNAETNGDFAAPTMLSQAGGTVSGLIASCAGCRVDVYSDADGQGRIHHGTAVLVGGTGPVWNFTGGVSGPNITATVTDGGNTSKFSAALEFSPGCGVVAVATIITAAKGQSPKNNPKVSHAITAKMIDAADYGPTAYRIKICEGTAVVIVVTDTTGSTTINTPLSDGIVCPSATSCTVGALNATEKYKSVSSDGKDTDRLTLLPE